MVMIFDVIPRHRAQEEESQEPILQHEWQPCWGCVMRGECQWHVDRELTAGRAATSVLQRAMITGWEARHHTQLLALIVYLVVRGNQHLLWKQQPVSCPAEAPKETLFW